MFKERKSMGSSTSTIIDDLMCLAPHTEIAHHIPGRVRIKVLPSGYEMALNMDTDELIRCIPGITRIKVNPASRSLVIEYDQERLPYELWEKLRYLKGKPELEMEIRSRLQNVCA